jgi:HK97 family phage major capsid protein
MDGGIFIPPTFESGIIMNAYDQAELRPLCNIGSTGRDTVIFPSLSKPTVAWGRKAIAVTEQDLSSGGKRMEVFFLTALTSLSIDTLDDAEANIVSEMTGGFGMAIAEAEDDAIAVGAGDDSPSGIASNTTVQANYSPSGVAAALFDASNNGTDCMLDAQYLIKKTYRRNAAWGMNSSTESVVRTLKDGNGQYMWQPSLQIGTPPTFDGYKIANPEGMADIAAGAIAMIFGDFNQYKIRDRSGMSVQRLVEKYAEYAQIGFLIRRRLGGMLVLPEAFSCVKIAAS